MVSMKYPQSLSQGRIKWSSIDVNNELLFDADTNGLNVTRYGMYFLSMSATVTSNTSMITTDTGRTLGLIRQTTPLVKDTVSRESIFFLSPINKPSILQNFDGSTVDGDDNFKSTSWTGFLYNSNNFVLAARNSRI